MNQKAFLSVILVGAFLFLGVYIMTGSLSANTSAISYLVRWIGMILAVVSFLKPKFGLYIVTAEAFTTDYIKKVAVYYGNTSMNTIMEVMMVVMLALMATYAGRISQMAFQTGKKPTKEEWGFYLVGALVSVAIFFKLRSMGTMPAGQQAFNIGVYIGVGGLVIGLLKDQEDLWKFYRYSLWFGVAWCLMSLKQIFWGYSDLEIFYMKTGLSEVATNQFFSSVQKNPRPSGFGSGTANLGAILVFYALALWAALNVSKKYWLIVILLLATCMVSQIKFMVAMCLLITLAYPFCKKKWTLGIGYACGILILGSLVFFSQYLLDNLFEIDRSFRGFFNLDHSWSIQTFSDRLKGWTELKNPDNWSFGPSGRDFGAHDEISGLLKSVGGMGVFLILMIGTVFTVYFHRFAFTARVGKEKNLAAVLSAYVMLSIIVGAAIGGLLKGQPQGLVVWYSAGGVFLLGQQARLARRKESIANRDPIPVIAPISPRNRGEKMRPSQSFARSGNS